ncbi:NADPH-dependent F420 reductase [Nocardioides hungaricus]
MTGTEGRVAVVGGTGALGYGAAVRLAAAGVSLAIGSRDAERAVQAADRLRADVLGADVMGLVNGEAVTAAERLVVLAVPLSSQVSTLKSIAPALREGQVVLDTTVPLAPAVGGGPTQVVGLWHGSAAQQAAAAIPAGVGLVSGLHTLSAALLEDLAYPLDQATLLCGDVAADKAYVASVLGRIDGLQVVDAGRLEMSRLVEGITAVLIGINIRNKTHAGVAITGLPSPSR